MEAAGLRWPWGTIRAPRSFRQPNHQSAMGGKVPRHWSKLQAFPGWTLLMSAKRWWPWPRPTSTSEPVAQELAPAPEPAAPFVTQTSLYRFQFALENLFRPYLEQKNRVTLDGRVLSLDQICRESGLLGAWVALVDLQAQTQNKMVVTRWGRHGGLVDLLPLGWRSDQVDVEASLVALVAPWLEKSHVELGGVFLPVAEGAALGKLVGVPPSILNWKHPLEFFPSTLSSCS